MQELSLIQRIPFIIALTGLFLGVLIAIGFGANEDFFQDRINEGLKSNSKIALITDAEEKKRTLKEEAGKCWRYYQRFHFHSTGIGAMSIGVLLLLMFSTGPAFLIAMATLLTSVGGFLYPFVWLFAGIYGPSMGRHEAKEAYAIFGYMGGVFLIGILLALWLIITSKLKFPKTNPY